MGRESLCWQSTANPSLPAKVRNAGRFCQNAARAATDPCRKWQHLNALEPLPPNFASRENPAPSREANTEDKVFGSHRRLILSDQKNEDEARHAGSGENDLEDALDSLPAGQRVFITYDDYAEHYSPSGEHWNEFDHEGMKIMREYAHWYECEFDNRPDEQRMYFRKRLNP